MSDILPDIHAVNAVILDQHDHVLLTLRQDMPFWNLPGGGSNKGEDAETAIFREVGEELGGLECHLVGRVGYYIVDVPERGPQTAATFLFRTQSSNHMSIQQPPDEEIKWRFFSEDKLPANIWPRHKQRIEDAFAGHMNLKRNVAFQTLEDAVVHIPLDSYVDLDFWLQHPAVLKNKENGTIQYWPEFK